MTEFLPSHLPHLDARLIALAVLVSAAAAFDLYTRRIPNILLSMGCAISFFLLAQSHGWMGITDWISGGALLLAIFVIPYAFGILGAGDVKLMATIGSFLGPSAALGNALLCMVGGGVLSLVVFFTLPLSRTLSRIPYAVSIALSTLTFIAL